MRATLSSLAFVLALLAGCTRPTEIAQFGGNTWGTTYQVTYVPVRSSTDALAHDVKVLLSSINQSLSTYLETSVISRINASMDTAAWHPIDPHFAIVFSRSRTIYDETKGAFNPAVGPLVRAWGFGADGPKALPDKDTIQALLEVVSFDAFDLQVSPPAVRKRLAGAQLDFNAIAEGYAVDAIAALLDQDGIRNYLVEIGGEVRARGQHPKGRGWRVGIARPTDNAAASGEIQSVISLENAALATSGNYRKYRVQDGKTFGHILNPRTGYPEQNSLLSVSVLAGDAATADAYATAFMVMGLDEAMHFVEGHKPLEAYFIIKDSAGSLVEKRSSGFPRALEQ